MLFCKGLIVIPIPTHLLDLPSLHQRFLISNKKLLMYSGINIADNYPS